MIYFLDTSALVKRYVAESGSALVRGLFSRKRRLAVSRIAYAEIVCAAARRAREGSLAPRAHQSLLERLSGDFGELVVVEVKPGTLNLIPELSRKYPLRAYDAVQLASALTLRAAVTAIDFWTTDQSLRRAALGEGLRATVLEG